MRKTYIPLYQVGLAIWTTPFLNMIMLLIRIVNAIIVLVLEGTSLGSLLIDPPHLPDREYGYFSPIISVLALILAIAHLLTIWVYRKKENNIKRKLFVFTDIFFIIYWLLQFRTFIYIYSQ